VNCSLPSTDENSQGLTISGRLFVIWRKEPTQIVAGSLLTLGYGYGTTTNNGNPLSHTIARPGVSTSLTYGYDGANRLQSAAQTGITAWSQGYGFDNFGNRWLSSYSGLPAPISEVPQTSAWYGTNNRISTWSYDSAGNILSIPTMMRTFTYDAENLQKTAAVNGTTTTYLYDGNGLRVKKTVGAGTPTVFVYDAMGNLAVEYGLPFDVGTKYVTADSLGSTRLVTKADGTVDKTYDYLPFGEQIGASYPSAPSGPSQKFTGQERDAESGLDNFQARYMSPPQGRFQSPDPAVMFVADPTNPQSWNLYAYVINNPLRFVDPTGLDVTCSGDADNFKCVDNPPPDPGGGFPINCFFYSFLCGGGTGPGGSPSSQQPPPPRPPLPANQLKPSTAPKPRSNCNVVDPVLGALEFKLKLGPEVQAGPLKVGFSLYKNLTTGDSGGTMDASAGLVGTQGEYQTPAGGFINGGSFENVRKTASFLGFQYDFQSRQVTFNPSKNISLGLQALVGIEVSLNSDTVGQLSVSNQACQAQGGHIP
jgi:RHS repeat-associated protein